MERPILFAAPMVRAILDGRKTQTRRIVQPQPSFDRRGVTTAQWAERAGVWHFPNASPEVRVRCPYGAPGDRLWVREAHSFDRTTGNVDITYLADNFTRPVQETYNGALGRNRPSIHMPRWASRILLQITDVRVQRLQDLSEEDAFDEGVWSTGTLGRDFMSCRENFEELWDSLNAKRAPWDSNPWVWAITFSSALPPISERG